MRVTAFLASLVFLLVACISGSGRLPDALDQRTILRNTEDTLKNLLTVDGNQIINKIIPHARALVVFPDLFKATIIVGGRYGQGIVTAREEKTGKWVRPAFVKYLQASWGLQVGIQHAGLILIVLSHRGVKALHQTHFKLGSGPKIKHGPIGKSVNVNLQKLLHASDIYVYSTVGGMFAEISWRDAVIMEDEASNKTFYHRPISHRAVLLSSNVKIPEAGRDFIHTLETIAPARQQLQLESRSRFKSQKAYNG